MPTPALVDPVYCTDEHILIREPGDYPILCPRHQRRAFGPDGVAAGWSFTSATVDFESQGVAPGNVLQVLKSYQLAAPVVDLLIVDAVAGGMLTLRRPGDPSGVGDPPAVGTALPFLIRHLGPQIERVSYDLNQQFNIDKAIGSRSADFLYDSTQLREPCVLRVLSKQYAAMARDAGGKGDFWSKANLYRSEYIAVLDSLEVRWGPNSLSQPSSTRFGTRMTR